MSMKRWPNDPKPGSVCWCCGAEAEYYATTTGTNWCFPCKFADPDCPGPCNPDRGGSLNEGVAP